MMGNDPMSLAIRHMTRLYDLVSECGKYNESATGEGVSRRARDLPSLVSSAGLVPALTFYMSKADENNYKIIYDYLGDTTGKPMDAGKCESLKDELSRKEKAGYASMLAASAKALEAMLGLSELNSYKALALELENLHRDSLREAEAEALMLDYLVEAKKLAEAFFSKEK